MIPTSPINDLTLSYSQSHKCHSNQKSLKKLESPRAATSMSPYSVRINPKYPIKLNNISK